MNRSVCGNSLSCDVPAFRKRCLFILLYLLPRRIVGRISFAAFESKSLHRRYCIVRIGWSLSCVALRHTRHSEAVDRLNIQCELYMPRAL